MDPNIPDCSVQPVQAFATQSTLQFLQPRSMRAFEKNLTKKIKSSEPYDYSAMYNGNMLQVSVNPDTDSDESSVDSLDDF